MVIAAIDEKSLDDPDLGIWPWSYNKQGKLIDQLTAYGAKSIGCDVVFSASDTRTGLEPLYDIRNWLDTCNDASCLELAGFVDDKLTEANHDQIFAEALSRSSRVVLGYFFHWHPFIGIQMIYNICAKPTCSSSCKIFVIPSTTRRLWLPESDFIAWTYPPATPWSRAFSPSPMRPGEQDFQ